MSNHALLWFVFSEHLRPITVCPTRIERIPYLILPTGGSTVPRLSARFYSFPQMIVRSVRCSHFNHQIPWIHAATQIIAAGINSDEVRGFGYVLLVNRLLFKALFSS